MSRNSYEQPPKGDDDAPWSPPTSDSSYNPSSNPDPITPRYETNYSAGVQYPLPQQLNAGISYPQQSYGYPVQPGGYPAGTQDNPPYVAQSGAAPYNPYAPHFPFPQKSRAIAAVLAFFFGAFGVHNFYLGRTGIGITQLLITVLSLFLLSWVSGIWAFIEMILYLVGNSPRWSTDAHGIPLQ